MLSENMSDRKKRKNTERESQFDCADAEKFFKAEWFHIPAGLSLKKLRTQTRIQNRAPTKTREYLNSKKEAERVRRQLLKLVKSDKTETDDQELPNSEERTFIKYHYYIHQGIDIVNIAPLENSWIASILERIPPKLRSKSRSMETLLSEVQDDFLLSVKRGKIHDVLQDCDENYECFRQVINDRRLESLDEIKVKRDHFKMIRNKIQKNLFKIHPTVVKINYAWFSQYRNMRIINVKELYSSDALELNQFSDWLISQIELCRSIILEKWIPSVFKIVSNIMDKKSFATIKEKKLKRFYECISTLMSLQLQTLRYKTITEYANFICDVKRSPRFQVHVLYKNNKIIFNPSYKDFQTVFLSAFEKVIVAVSTISRIETKLYEPTLNSDKLYLKPSIIPEMIERRRFEVEQTLEDEWICPELKIQDFDDYVCLINGQNFSTDVPHTLTSPTTVDNFFASPQDPLCEILIEFLKSIWNLESSHFYHRQNTSETGDWSRIEVNKFLSEKRDFHLFKEKVWHYHDLGIEISLLCSKVETIASFEIHREHFISILINKSQATKDRFLNKITDTYQEMCKRLNEEFQEIKDNLLKPPANTAELVRMKEYNLKLGTETLFEMEDRLRETMKYILFVSDYVPLSSGQIKQNSITFLWYRRINGILEENRSIIKERTKVFQDFLLNRIETFNKNLETYKKEVDEFQNYRDASELSKYLKKAQNLHKKFNAAAERIREFNEEEEAFGWMKTFYPKRDELVEKLLPYKKLYENCADYKNKYKIWVEAKIGSYSPEEIEENVKTFHSNVVELSKEFSSNPAPYALTSSVKLEVEQFQKHMSIVKTLGNPCLQDRHWEKISEIVGFPLRVEDDLTLAKILDYGFEEYVDKFQTISDSATKENCLEMKLNRMIAEWQDVKFAIASYRDSGTFVLTTTDEIQVLLDDHIVKTQMMKNSPYIKPFENAIHAWEEKLILLQEIIDTWLVVQKAWVYLEPIFSFSDIQHLIPEESKRFNALDKIWKDIMKSTSLNTAVLQVINIEKVLERLAKCSTLLNMIQSGLTGFLETKRSFFPRFYFLSNKEILNIISNTRDPSGVRPYLKKCFTGVKNLRLSEAGDITSLISDLGEELNLVEVVDTGSKRGQVEKWLADLERVMKNSVKQEVKDALIDYEKQTYTEWIDSWTQQVLLLITGIKVGRELRERLNSAASIESFQQECSEKLESVIELLAGKVDLRKRYVLVSLIIFFLQVRDQLASINSKSELGRENELSMHIQYEMNDEDIVVRIFAGCIKYGCEYMGNFIPLIITPTTDSCYKFIFTSHKYHYGVCLEGPPGTGKTEIVRDFSRRVARHYVIFGCSKIVDHSVVGMLFKGIASSDVFVCFDNLDVVESEGLRIIEHYVTRIQQAIQFGDRCIKLNGLNSHELSLDQITFATMSTKFSLSRTRLPPLLRTYLRPFNFNRNERKTIITTKLLLLGFKNFEFLAEKLETIFRIGEELFRSKNYLTNDVRTLEAVMKNVTGIKLSRSLDDEEKILSNAVETFYRPLYFAEEWLLLKKILDLTFKNVNTLPLDVPLTNAVRDSCKRENIVFDGNIFDKVQQLLNAMNHFTGVILVGDTFGGKSTLLKILSTTFRKSPFDEDVEMVVINPKSVTLKQLFGHQDKSTEKWVDGIFSTYYRQFRESNSVARKWLIFDGPMDTSWVENLNSVLDGSKKLCLESGESILLGKRTHLIFETQNLSNVSPYTISRCAIIAVKSSFIKWEYLLSSWLNTLPPSLSESHKDHIQSMALRFCRVLFYFIENCCEEPVYPVTKNHMIRSLCDFFDCFMDDYKNEDYIRSLSEIDMRSQLEGVFSFSCIWSVGGLLNEEDKGNFDALFRALQRKELSVDIQKRFQLSDDLCRPPNKRYVYVIPDLATVFDYQYVKEGKGKWKLWSDGAILNSPISRDLHFRQIVVPTKTTIRNQHLISLLANKQKTVMLVGDTASGKTTDITYFVNTKLDVSEYKAVYLNFSAGSTGNSMQNLIDCKLEKRKKGVYGPPLGIRYVLFIDDMNAATVDEYGTNSAIELLRHWLEYGCWYNLDNASVVRLIDMQFLCVATTNRSRVPRTSLCSRFTKFCNIINNEAFNEEVLRSIFSKIMLWHLDTRGFSKEFDPCIEQIVNATLAIHRRVRGHLLPVPEKSHYIFNLRDFAKIIQGVVLSVPEAIEDLSAMKRLWVHEVTRIYHDRISDSSDSDWFIDNLRNVMQTELAEDLNVLLQHLADGGEEEVRQRHLQKLIFCDFINPKADVRNYAEMQDMDGLQSIVEGYLTEYNNVNKNTMNLLLFSYSIEHLSRICRIIKQPQGHALLLGEYGSGKQSLAKLAIHMCEYEFFEIEFFNSYNQTDWREDMKNLLFSVYTNQHSAFLCTNIQTLTTSMLEDINNLLQYAEIPEIFTQDDKTEIYEKMEIIDNQRDKALQTDGSHEALFNLFLQRIKRQIHVVMVVNMSVYDFREFFYRFPAFLNCCTIDWFEPWSEETQTLMAQKLLHNVECEYNDLQLVVKLCNEIHNIAKKLSEEINTQFGVNVHFTQKTFTGLVIIFRDLFTRKQKELRTFRKLYEEALSRLAAIKEQIPILEHNYKTLLPLIHEKKSQVEKLESSTEIDREAETEAEIALNGAKTKLKNCEKKLNLRKVEYEKRLKEVMDVHENVTESLQLLSTNDIAVLKSMKNPPRPVKLVAEALVYIKELKAEKMQESGKIIDDFWKPAVKLIGDSKFIDMLVNFNPTDVSARVLRLLEDKIITQEDFDSDKIKSYSSAAETIFRWISVVYEFNKVTKMDSDVKINLSNAGDDYESAKSNVAEREVHLQEAKTKRENLLGHLDNVKEELDQLETEANNYSKKNTRAGELVQILDSKKELWSSEKRKMEEKNNTLIGDVLLCSAILSYLTSVPQRFRHEKISEWQTLITSKNLSCGAGFKFPKCLLDEMELEEIKFATIVEDEYFNEILAIIRHSSHRYPLLIDPNGLMTSWIKNVEHGNNIVSVNVDHENYLRNLENAITSGSPVLLEHVHDKLDPILYPVFEKQTFKTSTGIYIKIGRSSIEYNQIFRMYLSCEIRDSQFNPEIYEKLTVVNCFMEKPSVKNYLLKTIVKKDKPDLETFRQQSAIEFVRLKKITTDSEMKILNTLTDQRDILEAETEVNNIGTDVMLIEESSKKIADLNAQLDSFHDTVSEYEDSALYCADLFEIIENLRDLNFVYQFSLKWFKNLLVGTIERLEKVENTGKRLTTLCESFLHNLFSLVTHSLVEMDKLVFAYLLALYTTERRKWCSTEELNFCIEYLQKYALRAKMDMNSSTIFLENINTLNEFENFKGVLQIMKKSEDVCDRVPEYDFTQLDGEWQKKLNPFQNMLLKNCFFSDTIIDNIRIFTKGTNESLNWDEIDLKSVYKESKCCVPITLIVFDASDPTSELFDLASSMGISLEKCKLVTVFKADNTPILEFLDAAKASGSWLIVRNLQYIEEGFKEMEKVFELLTPSTVHPDFRLWIIVQSNLRCSEFILRNSFTVAYEKSDIKDIDTVKQNTSRRLNSREDKSIPAAELYYFSSLIVFHRILTDFINELPFNQATTFNEVDFLVTFNEILSLVLEPKKMNLERIYAILRHCTYGPQITNEWDLRYLISLKRSVWNEKILPEFPSHDSGLHIQTVNNVADWISIFLPSLFELYSEMVKLKKFNKTNLLLQQIVKVKGCHKISERTSKDICTTIEEMSSSLPEIIRLKSPPKGASTRNVFTAVALVNETEYYNAVISNVKSNLLALKNSLKGHSPLTGELEIVLSHLNKGRIRVEDSDSHAFLTDVNSFRNHVSAKFNFLSEWAESGVRDYDLAVLKFPKNFFILNSLQRCLDQDLPINKFHFENYIMLNAHDSGERTLPRDEIRVSNLLFSNANWNPETNQMTESTLETLHEIPSISLVPHLNVNTDDATPEGCGFLCPVYQIGDEKENEQCQRDFVIALIMPNEKCYDKWIKRRVNSIIKK